MASSMYRKPDVDVTPATGSATGWLATIALPIIVAMMTIKLIDFIL